MGEIESKIANTARAVNRQIDKLAVSEMKLKRNVLITEDGKICEITNHMKLRQTVDDDKHVLDDLLRNLDMLLKERDGI